MLTAKGHTASCAPEGKEAFQAIRLLRPDLIIVEVALAKIGALASEQRLHTPEGPRTIPVIIISDCLKLEAELLHIFDFLAKPLDLNRLFDDVAAISARPANTGTRPVLSDRHYLEFSQHILSCTGLLFEPRNRFALERGLWKRMSVLRLVSYTEYLDFLKLHGKSRLELQKLLQFLTVGETYFFRYPTHFEALKERLSGTAGEPPERIRIWSAGCSTGEEPYSIAISIMEALPDWRRRDIKILASDINHQSLKRARDGVYSPWSLRATGRQIQERYFDRVGENFLLRDEVKRLVEFSHLNLSSDSKRGIRPEHGELDAIFCRNVMIYFSPETAARMVDDFAACLKPTGLLFLGHAETSLQRSPQLEIRCRENSFYYCKLARGKAASSPAPLQAQPLPPAPCSQPEPAPTPAARLSEVQRLFDAEQVDAAEELLEALLKECPDETGALVLKGFLLAGKGRFQEALEVCGRVLGVNDLLAEAYFLKGVVLDASGRLAEAADEYRKALLLEHDFIMPRYYMGRLHLRRGRGPEAKREIRNSLRILARRDETGTLPYSGGLTLAVCKALLQNDLAHAD
jgi:chemotaxis protein methyltransferase CheR